ncbi:MAG: monofunctional biosynthetic peptidoglycan transglycosylase [Bacteroidota bacterium]
MKNEVLKIRLKRIRRWVLLILVAFLSASIVSVVLLRFMPVPLTPLMVIRCAEQTSGGEELKLSKKWTSLSALGDNMAKAVIAAEDQKFEEHFGFDFEAIKKARQYNQRHEGKRLKGASTISQQTAKNVFLWPGRSWIRKGFEVYFTFLIEVFWSKERILEVYLNVIETGDGIYGAEAAAQTFFNKPCNHLSASEAALIAAVLPNPRRWRPDKPSAYISRKAVRISRMMGNVSYGE